jgi:hypothetical protein
MHISINVKYQPFLSDFNKTYVFLTDFRNIIQYKISQNCLVGAKLFIAKLRTEGRTDMTKLTVGFRNFANASQNPIKFFSKLGSSVPFVTQSFNGMRVALTAFRSNIHH